MSLSLQLQTCKVASCYRCKSWITEPTYYHYRYSTVLHTSTGDALCFLNSQVYPSTSIDGLSIYICRAMPLIGEYNQVGICAFR